MATSVKLDDAMMARIRNLAGMRQRSPHWIMREAIAQYVEREERREALNRETAVAWDEYQGTGKHVTSEAVNE
ncbi:ribbon-helix-helix domain-containing protein [Pseudomonas sp. 273]|uniref:CopG family ribbon-helix-helix protein n=1 Tax=Pseudomonas sp. 273 TaxID=75692 RepID=UPI0023D7E6B0|nr:ribbon-helix-helix domain-containing protein [Pseudomonas sp. 273]